MGINNLAAINGFLTFRTFQPPAHGKVHDQDQTLLDAGTGARYAASGFLVASGESATSAVPFQPNNRSFCQDGPVTV